MNVTILGYQEPDQEKLDIAIEQVAAALEQQGHKVATLAIHDDVVELVEGLKKRKPDLVFNLVESFANDILGGLMGVAGVLDLLQIPFTGGGPGELYLQEDKALSKKLLAYENVLYPDYAAFAPGHEFETGGNLRMPLFVKPMRSDASIGIDAKLSLVRSTTELMERVLAIHKQCGDAALAEEYIEGREFYVSVLGNSDPIPFPPVEMDFSGLKDGMLPVLDNKAKFDKTSDEYLGTKAIIPNLDPELKARLQEVATNAYRALRVRDYGRVDLRLKETGEIFVIEVNASCYLERDSEFAISAAAMGIEYPALIGRIADLALERCKNRVKPKPKRRPRKKKPANGAEKLAVTKPAAERTEK